MCMYASICIKSKRLCLNGSGGSDYCIYNSYSLIVNSIPRFSLTWYQMRRRVISCAIIIFKKNCKKTVCNLDIFTISCLWTSLIKKRQHECIAIIPFVQVPSKKIEEIMSNIDTLRKNNVTFQTNRNRSTPLTFGCNQTKSC